MPGPVCPLPPQNEAVRHDGRAIHLEISARKSQYGNLSTWKCQCAKRTEIFFSSLARRLFPAYTAKVVLQTPPADSIRTALRPCRARIPLSPPRRPHATFAGVRSNYVHRWRRNGSDRTQSISAPHVSRVLQT